MSEPDDKTDDKTKPVADAIADAIADALAAHDWSDWYKALLLAALDETGDVDEAVRCADAAFAETPEPPPEDAVE